MIEPADGDSPTGAEIVLGAKALATRPHEAKALAAIAAIPWVGGPLATYLGAGAQEKALERVEQLAHELTKRVRTLERQKNLDRKFLKTEEAVELFGEVAHKVVLERDNAKRKLFASILANTARVGVNRSFYPTALKLLDALEPIHVEILRELRRRQEKHEAGAEHNTSTRELAIKLHLQELEQLRLGGLSDEIPHLFSQKPDGVHGWDAVLGAADTVGGPGAEALKDKFREWDDDILAHLQYMGKEGLVENVSERRSNITQQSLRLLEWLAEPEDWPTLRVTRTSPPLPACT